MSETPEVQVEEQEPRATHALLFELEYVAVKGRQAMYEGVKKALKPKGVELTPIHFSRAGLSPLAAASVSGIMKSVGKKTAATEKLAASIDAYVKDFCEKSAVLDKGMEKLIDATLKLNIPVIAFTALPEAVATKLMEKLGLTDKGVELVIPDEVKESFPRADSWLKILKKCDKEDATLVAVVSSRTACKGGLTAGAAVIAVPDEYTAYQDFSGAKMVVESLSDVKPNEILDLTLRM